MQANSRRADHFPMTGHIRKYHSGDNPFTASRQVIEVSAKRRRAQRMARDPTRQSRQLGGILRQVIPAAPFQAGKPVNLLCLFMHSHLTWIYEYLGVGSASNS